MELKDIKVPMAFKKFKPNQVKIDIEMDYYKKNGTISKPMLITPLGFIIDGYIKYIVLKENNFEGPLPESFYMIGEDVNNVVSFKENLASDNSSLSYSSQNLAKNIRKIVYNNDGGYCYLCGTHINNIEDMTIDHVQPKSEGGGNIEENNRCCCFTCNQMKGSMNFDDFIEKVKMIYNFRNLGS